MEKKKKAINLIEAMKKALFSKSIQQESVPSEFKYRYEDMKKKHPNAPRWFVRNQVRQYFDPRGNIGSSMIARAIKKEHGQILSRKERRKKVPFVAIANR